MIFAFRVRRLSRMRPLKLEQLWIGPAICLVVVAASLAVHPPTLSGWAMTLAGVAIGLAPGTLAAMRVEMYLRGTRLLAAARAGR